MSRLQPIPFAALLALLVPVAAAQGAAAQETALPVGTPRILPDLTVDLSTGAQRFAEPVAAGSGGVQKVLMPCFSNASMAGSFTIPPVGDEFVDWGAKSCALTGFVGGFTIAYGTTARDVSVGGPGAAFDFAIFQGTSGGGSLGTEVARVSFTGLPGATGTAAAAFVIPITVVTPLRFSDGAIGWSYVGTDGLTGPLLVGTSGVCNGTPDPTTGTQDCLDVYAAPATGASFVTKVSFLTPGISSLYLELQEPDGSGSTSAVINGSGVNPLLFSEDSTPIPTHPWTTHIDLAGHPNAIATVVAFSDDPIGPITLPYGELLIAPGPPSYFFETIGLGTHTSVPPNAPSLLGEDIFTQGAIFDPTTPAKLILLNGITFTMNP